MDYQNCYQNLTRTNKYTYHYYCNKLLELFNIDINNYDVKEKFIKMEDI